MRKLAFALCIAVAVAALRGGDKFDLKRITPVPDSEPIPVSDFFRPNVLQEPVLNPAGTYIAAIISAGEETHGMAHLDNQVELYSRIEAFLAKNMAPVP